MLNRFVLIAICLSLFGGSVVAYGQGSSPAEGASAERSDRAQRSGAAAGTNVRTDSQGRKITTIDFDDAYIDGAAKSPEGFFLRSRDRTKVDSVLELRKSFRRRMRASGHEGLRAVPMR